MFGLITILTERASCGSFRSVVEEFKDVFPIINVDVLDGGWDSLH